MEFKEHEYQRYAIEFIKQNPIAAVLLDMGLGKTVITLTAIKDLMFDSFEVQKVLIVAPLRVARNTWTGELQKWEHLKGLKASVVVGTPKERLQALSEKADIYIINREMVTWLVNESATAFDYDMVVIDELSSFKNHQAQRFKALMNVRPRVKRVVGLTGTPTSNGLMDLFAEYKILDMGKRLGRFITRYRQSYFLPDKQNGMIIYSYKPQEDAEQRIYSKISDITISMKATDFLQMPELISTKTVVKMTDKERKIYDRLKRDQVLDLAGQEVTVANAATLAGKLSQLANGAIYDDDKNVIAVHDQKLDALEDIIESMNGKPLLVAYWFKHDLTRIKKRLTEKKIDFSEIKTDNDIKRWNSGEIPVALIHPASVGHGLNLQQGGNTLVWFGLTWSLEVYQQTNARIYRQGQQSSTVVIQHIVAANTIDGQILKALEDKDKTQEALIKAVKAEL